MADKFVDDVQSGVREIFDSEPGVRIVNGISRIGSTIQDGYERAKRYVDSYRTPPKSKRGDIRLPTERKIRKQSSDRKTGR